MVFVSLGFRLRVEVEALNMVEALGAYTRHRTVPVLKKVSKDGKVFYRVLMVPAVSGQSVANGYQRVLVEMGTRMGLPVCDECRNYERRGGFTKHATEKQVDHDSLVVNCVVEDLTGFLAPEAGVRRTSPVMFSYMVPDVEGARAALESQFHVRYNMLTGEHNPFNVESGTAVYMLSVGIDVRSIGRKTDGSYVNERERRVELALKALSALLEGLNFGAKKARYLPVVEVVGAVGAVSSPIPFMVSPPRVYRDGRNYIDDTVERARSFAGALREVCENIKVVYMDKEGLQIKREAQGAEVEVESASTVPEFVGKILDKLKPLLEGRGSEEECRARGAG